MRLSFPSLAFLLWMVVVTTHGASSPFRSEQARSSSSSNNGGMEEKVINAYRKANKNNNGRVLSPEQRPESRQRSTSPRHLKKSGGKGGRGKGGVDNVFDYMVDMYQDPPAGVFPGDVILGGGCEDNTITLTDDLECFGEFNCLTLDLTDGDVVLDCDGYSITGYHDDDSGIFIQHPDTTLIPKRTATIKNCIVSGFDDCIVAASGLGLGDDYNVIIENTAAVTCQEDGFAMQNGPGDLTMIDVVAIGNGEDGIDLNGHEGNLVLQGIFACGNAKDDDGDTDIDLNDDNLNPINAQDITVGTIDYGTLSSVLDGVRADCPIYEAASCIRVTMGSEA